MDQLTPSDVVSDGFGSTWVRCNAQCDLVVVRPGKVQCSCPADDGEAR